MKQKTNEGTYKYFITIFILLSLLLFLWMVGMGNSLIGEPKKELCWKYTNTTDGAEYSFGKCYVKGSGSFETREKCGLFGISCYETSEPYTKTYTKYICYNAKTGAYC